MKCLAAASAKARKDRFNGCGYRRILAEGEQGFVNSQGLLANPYPRGTEEHDIWIEGYNDRKQVCEADFRRSLA